MSQPVYFYIVEPRYNYDQPSYITINYIKKVIEGDAMDQHSIWQKEIAQQVAGSNPLTLIVFYREPKNPGKEIVDGITKLQSSDSSDE
jgi:hypothetical protein